MLRGGFVKRGKNWGLEMGTMLSSFSEGVRLLGLYEEKGGVHSEGDRVRMTGPLCKSYLFIYLLKGGEGETIRVA